MRTLLASIVIVVGLVASWSSIGQSGVDHKIAELEDILGNIDGRDGIDVDEAHALMQVYFGAFLSGCGFPEEPTLHGTVWKAPVRLGVSGELLSGKLEVNSKSGGIGFAGCPMFATIEEFEAAVVKSLVNPHKGLPCWEHNRVGV